MLLNRYIQPSNDIIVRIYCLNCDWIQSAIYCKSAILVTDKSRALWLLQVHSVHIPYCSSNRYTGAQQFQQFVEFFQHTSVCFIATWELQWWPSAMECKRTIIHPTTWKTPCHISSFVCSRSFLPFSKKFWDCLNVKPCTKSFHNCLIRPISWHIKIKCE